MSGDARISFESPERGLTVEACSHFLNLAKGGLTAEAQRTQRGRRELTRRLFALFAEAHFRSTKSMRTSRRQKSVVNCNFLYPGGVSNLQC